MDVSSTNILALEKPSPAFHRLCHCCGVSLPPSAADRAAAMPLRACRDSVYEYLEKEQGLKIGYATKEISIQNAGELDRRYLDLGSYDLVVVVVGYTYTLDGRVFQYTESRHRPDHFRFVGVAQR